MLGTKLFDALGPSPARTIDRIGDFRAFAREWLGDFRHRFHGPRDAAALLHAIAQARAESGTLRAFFESEYRPEEPDVAGLLSRVAGRQIGWMR